MPRKKRDTKPFNINMDRIVYDRLEEYAEEMGQTKTMAAERILTRFFDEEERLKEQRKEKRGNGEQKNDPR